MKKTFILLVTILMFTFLTYNVFSDDQIRQELNLLMKENWESTRHEELDSMISCFWPDALTIMYHPNGESVVLDGRNALRDFQASMFEAQDYQSFMPEIPEPDRFFPKSSDMPVYIYNFKDIKVIEIFYFQKRSGEYRILELLTLPSSD